MQRKSRNENTKNLMGRILPKSRNTTKTILGFFLIEIGISVFIEGQYIILNIIINIMKLSRTLERLPREVYFPCCDSKDAELPSDMMSSKKIMSANCAKYEVNIWIS